MNILAYLNLLVNLKQFLKQKTYLNNLKGTFMGVAVYLRNHYGQIGVGAAAIYTAAYTGATSQAQKWATSIFMDHGTRTINCVLHQDKEFKKLCGSINNQTKGIWDNIHTDTKAVMVTRLSPLQISQDIQNSVNSVSQWVNEAANINHLHRECLKEKKDTNDQLALALNQTVEALEKALKSKDEAFDVQNNIIKVKDDAKAEIDPCNVRIGECKELEKFKVEVDRLKQVEIEYEALKIELKHSKKWAYEKLMGW